MFLVMLPNLPSFPQIPGIPALPPVTQMISSAPPKGPSSSSAQSNTLAGTFSNLLKQVSGEIQEPYQMSKDMLSGKREFDSAELMMSMMAAEKKLNTTIRIINDLIKGIKQLEMLQG